MQFAFVTLALACFAVANPTFGTNAPAECNTGKLQCCNSVQKASSPQASELLGSLGIAAKGVTGQVGITCTPFTLIGASTNSCQQQTVCCANNNFDGVVALGCTPVNVNL